MASNFLRKPSLGVSSLQGLADYFEEARKQRGIIALPDNTFQTIKDYRAQGSEHSAGEVETIVRALEPRDSQLCMRLDSKGLVSICSVLVHSQTCLAQQRGLYLLAESIYTTPIQVASESANVDQQNKKVAVGSAALSHLVKGFASTENADQTRRGMGVLALELLKDCPENMDILRRDYTKLQMFAAVIKHGQCQVLKLLAGSMINIMLNHGIMSDLIWEGETDPSVQKCFPRADQQDTQWVTSFEGYVEEFGLEGPTQERSSVIFAYALSVGERRYSTNEESAILVTVSQDLSIVIPESATGPATYIDVPLNAIGRIQIKSQANSQSQSLCFALIMQLRGDAERTCYLNASARNHASIALAFVSETDARILERLIQPTLPSEAKGQRLSVSQGISVSQPYTDESSLSPAPQENQSIADAASVVSPIIQKPLPDMNQSQKLSHDIFNKTDVSQGVDRAGEGSVGDPSAIVEHEQLTEVNAQQKKSNQKVHKEDAVMPAKISRVQKHIRDSKKAKAAERKKMLVLESLNDGDDEYTIHMTSESSATPTTKRSGRATVNARQDIIEDSSKGVPRSPRGRIEVSEAHPIVAKTQKTNVQDEESISNEEVATSRLINPQPQLKTSKPAKEQSARVTKSRGTQQGATQHPAKSRPKPAAPTKQRPTREAAKKANARIQGVETKNGCSEMEQALPTEDSNKVLKDNIEPRAAANPNERTTYGSESQAYPTDQSISPNADPKIARADKKASDFGCLSKPEADEVALVADPPKISAPQASTDTTFDKPAAQLQTGLPGKSTVSRGEAVPTKPVLPRHDHPARTDQEKGAFQDTFVPDSIPQSILNGSGNVEEAVADSVVADYSDSNHVTMMGETEDSHFQEALGDARDRASLSTLSSPSVRRSGRLAKAAKKAANETPKKTDNSKSAKQKDHNNLQKHDPFETKLGSLVLSAKAVNVDPKQIGRRDIKRLSSTVDPPDVEAPRGAVHQLSVASHQGQKKLRSLKKIGDNTQPKQCKPSVRNPQESGTVGKRKLEKEEDKKQTKKVKLAPKSSGIPSEEHDTVGRKDVKAPMPVNKKPELISWGASGPRNQGAASGGTKITKAETFQKDAKDEDPGKAMSEVRRSSKRKVAPLHDDPVSLKHDQPIKRQEREPVTPSRSRQHVPKMINEPTTAEMQGRARRLRSQSTKVDTSGSPLPVTRSQVQDDASNEGLDATTLVFDQDESIGVLDDNEDVSDPQLPTVSDNAQAQTGDVSGRNVTKKGKQFPSSPKAPSAFANHYVLESGTMVHEHTLESVVPTAHSPIVRPQNPFVGGSEQPPSSFIQMLRTSKGKESERKNEDSPNLRSSSRLKRKAAINDDEDPDHTLVESEPQPKRRKDIQKAAEQASLLSQSTSEETSSRDEEEPEEEVVEVTPEFARLLDPHQANILDILTMITHRLVRHLVDKEFVVKELAADYEKEGHDLIAGYAKERDTILEKDRGELDQLRASMSAVFLQAQQAHRELGPVFLRPRPKKTMQSEMLQARVDEQQDKLRKAICTAAAGTFNHPE